MATGDGKKDALYPDYQTDEIQDASVYRAGYPGYRVFIFGKEVTSDVTEVRVNAAGGSAERTPGTCSITLVNPRNRYILDENDMKMLAQYKEAAQEEAQQSVEKKLTDIEKNDGSINAFFDALKSNLVGKVSEYSRSTDAAERDTLALEIYTTMAAAGFAVGDPTSAVVLAKDFIDIADRISTDDLKYTERVSIDSDGFGNNLSIKDDIILKKVQFLVSIEVKDVGTKDTRVNKTVLSYPYQQGDCVFHFNDPIRVVFRDPFKPSMWYWKFSGFVDSSTENVGGNKDSILTIMGTDVSKIPRYATVQIPGLFDSTGPELLDELLSPKSNKTAANSGLLLYHELFQGFTIYEILETIFFGSESIISNVDERVTAQCAYIFNNYGIDELRVYLTTVLGKTEEEIARLLDPDAFKLAENEVYNFQAIERDVAGYIRQEKLRNLRRVNLPPAVNPQQIYFRRRSPSVGLNYYVVGQPDVMDEALGAKSLKNFREWNEILHHRVKLTDLQTMAREESAETSQQASGVGTLEAVISRIGTDLDRYPVAGRVYYLAPAGLETNFSDIGVLNRDFGSVGMHSTFKDRLSYVYDLAEQREFRFYATPRGDMVFEIPFYDFDPKDFWSEEELNYDLSDTDKNYSSFEEVFVNEYAGNYDLSEVSTLNEYMDYFFDPSRFDYSTTFTIEEKDTLAFSTTNTDNGVFTAYRVQPYTVALLESANNKDLQPYEYTVQQELIRLLGLRLGEGATFNFVDTPEGAKIWSELMLNRINAEARNAAISILPRFGLMVNRPLHWRRNNYYANIVSIQDSIVWNSSAETTVNVNQIRAFSGYTKDKREVHKHFGDSDRPFNFAEFLRTAIRRLNKRNKNG